MYEFINLNSNVVLTFATKEQLAWYIKRMIGSLNVVDLMAMNENDTYIKIERYFNDVWKVWSYNHILCKRPYMVKENGHVIDVRTKEWRAFIDASANFRRDIKSTKLKPGEAVPYTGHSCRSSGSLPHYRANMVASEDPYSRISKKNVMAIVDFHSLGYKWGRPSSWKNNKKARKQWTKHSSEISYDKRIIDNSWMEADA